MSKTIEEHRAVALVDQQTKDNLWFWSAVGGMKPKKIAKAWGVKKMEVYEGIIRHYRYREQEQWIKEMQEKFPPPK